MYVCGACGYGEYGRSVNDGDVAAVSRRLYRNGARCGACYQIKCTEEECNEDGVRVVVTDQGESRDDSDFILSVQAFAKMAKPGMEHNLKAYGHVNVEYQRIPCQFPANNLMLKIDERSHYPNYLAFVFYYQASFYDITAVEIFEVYMDLFN
ncbi:Expansin-like B1 [Bienertia sinuspersici]